MKGKDMVYCSVCGEEYDRLRHPKGHKCDPKILKQIEEAAKAHEEVVEREGI